MKFKQLSWFLFTFVCALAGVPRSHAQTPGALQEIYSGIGGVSIADLTNHFSFPNSPTSEAILPNFEIPSDVMEDYGTRVRALVVAPASGTYTFWVAGDDNSVLFLGTDSSAASRRVIASVPEWTASREWTKYPSQQSAAITLTAGQKYYIEALMKEGGGGDNLAVRWQLPNGTIEEPIPGSRLEVFGLTAPSITQQPQNITVAEGGSATFTVQVTRTTGMTYQWRRNGQNISGANSASYTTNNVALGDSGAQFSCFLQNTQGTTTSASATLTVQADTTRPTISSVSNLGDSQSITVLFSEPVAAPGATTASNYQLSNGATVSSATFAGDFQTVILQTSPLSSGTTYTLTVNNVQDRATAPNTILANSQRTFSLDYTALDAGYILGVSEPLGPSSRRSGLTISEIMYNPAARTDGRNVEFIEIYNANEWAESLDGFGLSGDVTFAFPAGTSIPARSFVVVATVPADVQAAYGITGVLGNATVVLPNGGGLIQLRNRQGAVLAEVEYSDETPFPASADGAGHSLVLARPSYGESSAVAWAASARVGGSPKAQEPTTPSPYRTVVINEFLAHTDDPDVDFIELYNYGNAAVDLAGCFLSDSATTNKFTIPTGTSIPARGFVVFDQNQLGFSLSAAGETIFLRSPDQLQVIDAYRFGGQENGVTTGRYPDGAPSFSELQTPTKGQANSRQLVRDVAINEIMFNPISGNDDDEYIELHNRSTASQNLGGWRINYGVTFTFPSNTTIAPNGYVVVTRNVARMLTNYPSLNAGSVYGNFSGRLANSGERLTLEMPDEIRTTNGANVTIETIYIVTDDVTYGDGGQWGEWADGDGSSLELIDARSDNRLASNWGDSDETQKGEWTLVQHTGVLDNGNGAINELHAMILGGGEAVIDNLEVMQGAGANLVPNGTFESGLTGWIIQGNHVRSSLSAANAGYESNRGLHLRATSGGDNGANRVEIDLSSAMQDGNTATIRGRARWLRGHPNILLRLHGNHLEAVGNLKIPTNLGTPGTRNSIARDNVAPAIYNVVHSPVLPAANQAVTVTAQVHDGDGLSSLLLRYRVDPSTNLNTVAMSYRGAGFYSATIPGQAAGVLVAYQIQATDAAEASATSKYPANAPVSEALVRFGDSTVAGTFGVYRLWMTQAKVNTWSTREKLSNEPQEGTFVYGNFRVIHNAGGRYRGSPFIRPGYNTPTGGRCAYVWTLPKDNQLLGTDELNLDSLEPGDRDPTSMREMTSFWMADQLSLPFSYQRYVHIVVNGVRNSDRGIPIYTDTQQPDGSYMEGWFPDDPDGEIYKIDDWFEFNDSVGMEFNVDARLENYTTTGGVKKQARYRWSWERKSNGTLDDDYSQLFNLVDVMNSSDNVYVNLVENTIDAEQWTTVFALRHAVGDWDGYGYNRGKNQFTYKPEFGKWVMLLWDLDFSLGCNGGHGPTQNLFDVNDGTINRFYNNPHFRRTYFRALQRIANNSMVDSKVTPMLNSRYSAFQANGISAVSPFVGSGAQGISIPDWISQRRTYILSQIPAATFAVTSNSGNNFSTNRNYISITGNAPVAIKTIKINGVEYPVTWNSVTGWQMNYALLPGANALTIQGYDLDGNPVGGASDTITVTYTGAAELAQNFVVINEIQYNGTVSDSEFIEILNTSTQTAFNLSGYQLSGVDYVFPDGTILQPGAFAVVAKSRTIFAEVYGANIPVVGEFLGNLDNGGETLRLIQPGATPEQNLVIDEVTYEDDAPWAASADGFGPSLQLIDPTKDNNRVANWVASTTGEPVTPQTLVTMTHTWKYNQSNTDLGTAWRGTSYNDTAWPSGAALLYVEPSALPAAKNTALTIGAPTYYFRTKFNYNGGLGGLQLSLSAILDDGAVFYLNGERFHALGMAETEPLFSDFSTRSVDNGLLEGPFLLPTTHLRNGENVLAVEVHQINAGSTDIAFGMALGTEPIGATAAYTPGAPNSIRATIAEFPTLRVNEVLAENQTGVADNTGEREPWVELHNAGTNAVNLSGYYLTDVYTNQTKWAFPAGTSIAAGQFLRVWLDGEPGETAAGHLHASFRPTAGGGSIALTQTNGNSTRIVDYLNYTNVAPDRSYGLFPDSRPASPRSFFVVTPGAPNDNTSAPAEIYINEWLVSNVAAFPDPADSNFEDWFELYNAGDEAVDLTGYRMTDLLSNSNKFVVPSGYVIPAKGYLLVWADEETNQNTTNSPHLHADFKLSKGGEEIGLYAPDGRLVNAVKFGAQDDDVSQGRFPNGAPGTNYVFLPTTTPGAPNTLGQAENQPPVLGTITNKSVNEGSLLSFTVTATDPDAGQSLTYSADGALPTGATLNAQSGTFAWTPTEAQGHGTYTITVIVTDDGSPALTDTAEFTVTVAEVNVPPVLAAIGNKTVEENATLSFVINGTDTDLPAQTLTYTMEGTIPVGASFNAATRTFTWTPTGAAAPSTNTVTFRVTDNGSPAASDSEIVTIVVTAIDAEVTLAQPQVNPNGSVTLSWSTVAGRSYRVEFKNSLTETNWQLLTTVTAEGTNSTTTDNTNGGQTQRYYRIQEVTE